MPPMQAPLWMPHRSSSGKPSHAMLPSQRACSSNARWARRRAWWVAGSGAPEQQR